ncbi:MAG: hypothetical protein ACRD32_04825 [Nitrososphaerales archaeon]
MGRKGRSSRSKGSRSSSTRSSGRSRTSRGGGAGQAVGELIGGATRGGGFGVDKQGRVMRTTTKRRKKGYRTPHYMVEMMRTQQRLMENVATAVLLNATHQK